MLDQALLTLAQTTVVTSDAYRWTPLINSIIFGLVGIAMTVLGFKVFEWATPKLDVERELSEHKNVAVAIVAGAMILGIAWIVSAAIS